LRWRNDGKRGRFQFIEKWKYRPAPRGSALETSSIGCGEIVDNLANVDILDRRTIDLDHLRHFGLPEVLLSPRGWVLM
jgi:hypothetical protein